MICKNCCEAADYIAGSEIVFKVGDKIHVRKVEHCKDAGCACQHREMKKEEYLNG